MANYRPLGDEATLDDRIMVINMLLEQSRKAEGVAGRRRWEAGVELLAAQPLVPKGAWIAWVKKNITARSYKDACAVMKLAGADDPEQAHEEEKAERRERHAKAAALVAIAKDVAAPRQDADTEQSTQRPALRLVPKVDPEDQVVAAWEALGSIQSKTRVAEQIQYLLSRLTEIKHHA